MKYTFLLCAACALIGLAGCGVDGEPITPTKPRATANVGIGKNGVRVGSSLGASIGNVNIGVGHVF